MGKAIRTNADNIELEAALQELALNLRGDAVETDMALGEDSGRGHCCCLGNSSAMSIEGVSVRGDKFNGVRRCELGST